MEQILWAVKAAPVADTLEWAVLVAMAEAADQDGTNSFLSVTTIADRTRLAERTVQRRMNDLEDRGLIRRGDQTAARRIPADRRPVVYDLMVPLSYFRAEKTYGDGPGELSVNVWRAGRGRPPLTAKDRPDLPPPPEKKPRTDKGTKRGKTGDGVTESHPVSDESDGPGVTTSHPRGDSESPHGVSESHPTLPSYPPHDPPRSAARSAATADDVDPLAGSSSYVPRASARAAAADAPRHDQRDEASPVAGPLTPRRPETPAGILEAAMLTPDEQASFRQWLIEQTGARNPDGLIVSLSRSGALSGRILEWRTPASPAQSYPSPSTPPRAPWCGNCDPDTRAHLVWSEQAGGEVVVRCRDCHPLAGQIAPGAGAAADIARDTHQLTPPGDGRAAFLAARARLPKGTGRRRTAHDNATHPTHTEGTD